MRFLIHINHAADTIGLDQQQQNNPEHAMATVSLSVLAQMFGGGEVDLGMDLRNVQLLLHGHDKLVPQGLVQLHVPGSQEDGVGTEHPEEGGGPLLLFVAKVGQNCRGHNNVRLKEDKLIDYAFKVKGRSMKIKVKRQGITFQI